jgi:hypothetical protein
MQVRRDTQPVQLLAAGSSVLYVFDCKRPVPYLASLAWHFGCCLLQSTRQLTGCCQCNSADVAACALA